MSPQHNPQLLKALGIETRDFDYVVALAGNPNTGKSTVFNALTGLRQHTGNWPGKTVSRAEGAFQFHDKKYKLVDLPGTYSLLSTSEDEEIARNFILFGRPHCALVVVDATCLERNLNLVLQILEITDKVVVALNLMDEARRKKILIDPAQLEQQLGVPVVPTTARTKEGIPELIKVTRAVIEGTRVTIPYRIQPPRAIEDSVNQVTALLNENYPGLPNARWIALRLLDGDLSIRDAITSGEIEALTQ